jgi:glycosyltransferase involved in cell wall biosynthesis
MKIKRLEENTVCHLTSVHRRYDTRIFIKECRSLAKKGYDVSLIVADGNGNEQKDGVKIIDIGKPSSRLNRVLFTPKKILKKALDLDASVYHFHDPELFGIALKLVRRNKKVIYDSHEDLPLQILNKPYIPLLIREPVSRLLEYFENRVASKISGVITVTPQIKNRFLKKNKKVAEIRNFPLVEEFEISNLNKNEKGDFVCYVGGISKIRGILSMVEAMKFSHKVKLLLGGKFESNVIREKAIKSDGWRHVNELGFLNRDEVIRTLQRSVAGLVVLEPTQSYLTSIPVKMFEYMSAGIPVIASDFIFWRELIEEENCTLFVDPLKPEEIGEAIQELIQDKKRAYEMGLRGQKAVLNKFNWSVEEKKLVEFYENIFDI